MNQAGNKNNNRDTEGEGVQSGSTLEPLEDIGRSREPASVRYAKRRESAALAASNVNSINNRAGSVASTSASTSRHPNTTTATTGIDRARVGGSSAGTSIIVAGVFKKHIASMDEGGKGSSGRSAGRSLGQFGRGFPQRDQEGRGEEEEHDERMGDEGGEEDESMMEDSMIQQSSKMEKDSNARPSLAPNKRKVNDPFAYVLIYCFADYDQT
jgi:hypothetical protein